MRIQYCYKLIIFSLIIFLNFSFPSFAQTHSKSIKESGTESIASLTTQLTEYASKYQDKNTSNRESIHSKLNQIIMARKAKMELLIEENTKKFLLMNLPVKIRNIVPTELKGSIEEAVDIQGQLDVVVVENSKTQSSEIVYFLKTSTTPSAPTHRYHLYFATGSPNIKTGDSLRVRGIKPSRDSQKIAMADPSNVMVIPNLNTDRKGKDSYPVMSLLAADRKILVILMNFRNLSLPAQCSASSLQNSIFEDPNGLKNFYQQTSFNGLNFSGDIAGPYTIDTNVGNSCDIFSWTDAADVMAQSQYNLNNYQHIVHIMPYTGTCAASGMATIGGNWSMLQGCPGAITHEIGHNLGMHHASKRGSLGGLIEYGDSSDVMATGNAQLNAPHMEQMQWAPSNNIETVTTAGVYTIYPLHNNSTMRQIIKIPYPCPGSGSGCHYYVSLRGPQEGTTVGGLFTHRASIHSFNTSSIAQTVLQETLNDGESFEDINNGILIQQIGHASDGGSITVFIDPQHVFSCVRQPPTLELNPFEDFVYQGRTLLLDGTITNNDSSACNSNVFSLQIEGNGSIIPQFFPSTLTLAPGGSQSFSVELSTNLNTPAGQYPLQITGSNTAYPDIKHTISFPFLVLDLSLAPDLTILNISHAPTTLMEGDTVTFTSLIRNQGATDAIIQSGGAGAPYLLITIDNQRNIWCEITSLSSGSSQSFSCGPWQATLGTHQIRAVVNPLNLLIESDHNNNHYLSTLVVVPHRDITPPTGSIFINPQPASTSSRLSLTINTMDAESGMGVGAGMQFSNDGSNWSSWMPYATSTTWYASSGLGFKQVYVRFKDVAGNVSVVYSDTITIMDTTVPTGYASVAVVSGNYVNLNLYAYDAESGMYPPQAQMKFSNDNSTWSGPEAFASSKWWPLSPGYGSKTIYIKFKDAAGNWSQASSVSTYYQSPDTTPPTGYIRFNSSSGVTTSANVMLSLYAMDSGSGSGGYDSVTQMKFSNDNITWSTPEAYSTSKSWTLSAGYGNKIVYVKFKDTAGNWSNSLSATITYRAME